MNLSKANISEIVSINAQNESDSKRPPTMIVTLEDLERYRAMREQSSFTEIRARKTWAKSKNQASTTHAPKGKPKDDPSSQVS